MLSDYQTRVSPRESNSRSVTVDFVNAAAEIAFDRRSVGDINLVAYPISGITEDIDGDIRNADSLIKERTSQHQ
ncbi:MAG: hypothetical protein IPM38_06730 [Ignavibacteria bacterium]|nr:hypothetical protein [Ignavibacteria bacterium]